MSEEVYTQDQVLNLIKVSRDFAVYVTDATKRYIKSINLPPEGQLSNFDFDIDSKQFTVNHTFVYKNEVKQCFYIIPMSVLWDHLL